MKEVYYVPIMEVETGKKAKRYTPIIEVNHNEGGLDVQRTKGYQRRNKEKTRVH